MDVHMECADTRQGPQQFFLYIQKCQSICSSPGLLSLSSPPSLSVLASWAWCSGAKSSAAVPGHSPAARLQMVLQQWILSSLWGCLCCPWMLSCCPARRSHSSFVQGKRAPATSAASEQVDSTTDGEEAEFLPFYGWISKCPALGSPQGRVSGRQAALWQPGWPCSIAPSRQKIL